MRGGGWKPFNEMMLGGSKVISLTIVGNAGSFAWSENSESAGIIQVGDLCGVVVYL